ncbi:MAG: hypothetical protein ACRDRU_15355 [Pseudonocardiaceae bacterium]
MSDLTAGGGPAWPNVDAGPASFELITVGNALHRLDRPLVAGRVLNWPKPDSRT